MKTSGGQCPVNHTGVELVRHSFAQVAASFDGLKTNRDHEEYVPRGGVKRPDKTPRGTLQAVGSYRAPGYGVEATFDQRQLAYVGISMAALNKLLRGELLFPHNVAPGNFVDRVVDDVKGQDRRNISFGGALARSVLQTFDDFGTYYPNLLPALHAMNRSGGSDGVDIAVRASEDSLTLAIRGEDPLAGNVYLAANATAERYTMENLLLSDEKTQEVWCPGEAVGRRIIRDSGRAAVLLAAIPEIASSYGTPLQGAWDKDRLSLHQSIDNRIDEMYQAARRMQPQ